MTDADRAGDRKMARLAARKAVEGIEHGYGQVGFMTDILTDAGIVLIMSRYRDVFTSSD